MKLENQDRRKFLKSALGVAATANFLGSAFTASGSTAGPDASAIHDLQGAVHGVVLVPGNPEYDAGRSAFDLSVDQRPAVVVMVESPQDVVAAVNFARLQGLGIGVQATGHGITRPADGGVLVNTSRMKGVEVISARSAARVQPGAKWKNVIPQVAPLGLVGLCGSSSDIGVVGFTLGGGTGWFARRYGYAGNSVISADLVTAGGRIVHASEKENPDLFWGIRGGTGNFGIVTALEFKLYPVKEFYGGGIFFPAENAREVMRAYSHWVDTVPNTLTSRVAIFNLPPIPDVPPPLRGKWVVAVQGAFLGSEAEGSNLLKPIRETATPIIDAFAMMTYAQIDAIANDPQSPMPVVLHSETVRDITPEFMDKLLPALRIGERSTLVEVELRHLGGALAAFPPAGSAVGCPEGKFWMNAIGVYQSPDQAALARHDMAQIKEAVGPYCTGRVFLNGLSGPASCERVRNAYAPENYARLVALKRKYDPNNLFRFNRNIDPKA